jgi:hypothetical protein
MACCMAGNPEKVCAQRAFFREKRCSIEGKETRHVGKRELRHLRICMLRIYRSTPWGI